MKQRLFARTLAALALACAVGAATAQVRELRFSGANPKGHPVVTGMERFAEIVAARSAGRLKVNLFPGGALGSDQASILALQSGTHDMHVLNIGILATQVKEVGVFDFPFMFGSEREADAVMDGAFGQAMLKKLEDKGLVGLAYFELGFRQITNSRRPLARPEDIAGLKLRVIPNAINVDWVRALEANPTPMAFGEVFTAMETKAIDGQENPLTVIEANKFDEVQKHLAITNHQYNPQAVVIGRRTWDALSADERRILQDAAREAATFQRALNRELMGKSLASLRAKGMQVTEFGPAELARFRERMKPVIDKHTAVVGAETVAALQAELAKLRR
jgi:tripartite ATP-independent transporter DctP family solute receptor